jgi:hypothetical protein
MTLLEVLVGVIAIALWVGTIVLVRLAPRVGRAADDVSMATRHISDLAPNAREFIESGRLLASTANHVAEDVRAVSGQARSVTSLLLRGFESEVAGRYRAIFSGARAAYNALRSLRSGNGSDHEEEFDHAARPRREDTRDGRQ